MHCVICGAHGIKDPLAHAVAHILEERPTAVITMCPCESCLGARAPGTEVHVMIGTPDADCPLCQAAAKGEEEILRAMKARIPPERN